jgi:hypothetical protein
MQLLLTNPTCWLSMHPVLCPIHSVRLVCFCPACLGALPSKRKAAAARENGRKSGGRPRLPASETKPAALYQRERRARLRRAAKRKGE